MATDPDGWPGFDISSTNKMQLDNRKEVRKGQEIEEGGNYRMRGRGGLKGWYHHLIRAMISLVKQDKSSVVEN